MFPICRVICMLVILTSAYSGLQTGNKGEVESPSRDRLVYATTCLIGHQVEVQVLDGSVFSGIFHATNTDTDFGTLYSIFIVVEAEIGRKVGVARAENW